MSSSLVPGTLIDHRYRLDRVVGQGGMGVVVQATHLVLQQRVALKFLRPEAMMDDGAVRRFVREARAAAKLQSEYIVRVHDVGTLADGTPFIAMEYLEGAALSAVLESHGALPVHEAVRFAIQICEALAVTHRAGIVHGDLKPENIHITGVGNRRRVKLLDFGISKITVEEISRPKFVIGTPRYMAPEQFKAGTIHPASDLWALGTVLHEMLAGAAAFPGQTPSEIGEAVMAGSLAPLARPDVPPGLIAVVQRCLENDPARRWASAVDLAAALELYGPVETALQRLAITPTDEAGTRTSQKFVPTVVLPSRRKGHGTWGIALLGLLGIVLLVLMLVGASRRFGSATASPSHAAQGEPAAGTLVQATTAIEQGSAAAAPPVPMPGVASSTSGVAWSAPTVPRRPARPPRAGGSHAPAPPAAPVDEDDRFGTRK